MKITSISVQAKNKDRVNISVDGTYRFSLDIFQVGELGIKVDKDFSEDELVQIEAESQFGKLYSRALEYALSRPHSAKEIRDYLRRKTRDTKQRNKKTGEITTRQGVSQQSVDRTFNRLVERGYVNDESFARFWVESRNQVKGSSIRKLTMELRSKGVDQSIIDDAIATSNRSNARELAKVIAKKQSRYEDEQKFIQYLMRQGFRYDDIKVALSSEN